MTGIRLKSIIKIPANIVGEGGITVDNSGSVITIGIDPDEIPSGFNWRGPWSSVSNYAINDGVGHEGASYIAIAANLNSEPPSANWDVTAQAGSTPVVDDQITPAMLDADTTPKQLAFRDRLNVLSRDDDQITPAMLDADTSPKQLAFRDRLNFVSRTGGDSITGGLSVTGGLAVTGDISTTGEVLINDAVNPVVRFGPGGLSYIYHDGTDFHADGGNLFLAATKGITCAFGTFSGAVSAVDNVVSKASSSSASPGYNIYNESAGSGVSLYLERPSEQMKLTHYAGGVLSMGFTAGPGAWLVFNTDNVYKPGGGPWLVGSDARIKTVSGDYAGGLDQVLALRPVKYSYRGNDSISTSAPETGLHAAVTNKEFIGLVAQEVETVMPEMVSQVPGWIDGEPVTDMRLMDTNALIYALVNSCKELAARIEALEAAATP